ncbi:MAG: hypothetical protein KI792_00675 [Alphaproteobacteria bacterium]|nr:hypothetical protein [Alphaproteobacteria bacterium SS10]
MLEYARMVRAILTDDADDLRRAVQGPEVANSYDETGRTPLHIAVMHSREKAIEPLMAAGADSELPASDGRTASEMAEEKGGKVHQHMIAGQMSQRIAMAEQAARTNRLKQGERKPTSRDAVDAFKQQRRSAALLSDN